MVRQDRLVLLYRLLNLLETPTRSVTRAKCGGLQEAWIDFASMGIFWFRAEYLSALLVQPSQIVLNRDAFGIVLADVMH
jgi:hypothetical protein